MKKPNILFIFSDQQHWQAVGFEDSSFDTPSLDRLAREGTVFTHSFCTTPQCSPSRSSIMTGLYPSKTGVLGNVGKAGGDPLRIPTIGTVLQDAGYYTAYFGRKVAAVRDMIQSTSPASKGALLGIHWLVHPKIRGVPIKSDLADGKVRIAFEHGLLRVLEILEPPVPWTPGGATRAFKLE